MADEEAFSGVVVLRGEKTYAEAFGFSNRSSKILNTLETQFSYASVTKMITAVSVLQLVEAKRLSLDTKVGKYLGTEGVPSNVTVYHLLTHASGISDYFDEDDQGSFEKVWLCNPNYTMKKLSDFLPLFLNNPPTFEAGTDFKYIYPRWNSFTILFLPFVFNLIQ